MRITIVLNLIVIIIIQNKCQFLLTTHMFTFIIEIIYKEINVNFL